MRFRFDFVRATGSTLPALAVVCALTGGSHGAHAQPADAPPVLPAKPAPSTADLTPPAPRNRTGTRRFESTITAVNKAGGGLEVTLRDGALTLIIKPSTELVREERNLGASDLKVDDLLSLVTLRSGKSRLSIKEKAVVTGLNPLTLKVSDIAVLTVTKADQWAFSRFTPLTTDALVAGQTVAVEMTLQRDGGISAKRLAVVVAKPNPPKARNTPPKQRKAKDDVPA